MQTWRISIGQTAAILPALAWLALIQSTLAETPAEVSAAQRAGYRDIIASEGLTFVGLHWLMLSPKGLHVTGPDEGLRRRSWDHIRALIDLCADLGPDGVLVFGSPNQRKTTGGLTREQATRNYIDGLASVAKQAESHGHLGDAGRRCLSTTS